MPETDVAKWRSSAAEKNACFADLAAHLIAQASGVRYIAAIRSEGTNPPHFDSRMLNRSQVP